MLFNPGNRAICYDLVGPQDSPVVCMAHSLSSDSGVWSEQLPALLADGWRVLRIDMRGHGGSDPGPDDCTMSDLAGDVALVLDFLGIAKVHFVGLSIGGMIGQAFALEHGDRLHSLFLTGTSPKAVPGPPEMWPQRFELIAQAGSLDPIADATMLRWFTDGYVARNPERLRQIRSTVANTSPAGYIAGARAIIAFDVLERLPEIRAATMVVCGDDDPGTPAEGNRLIARLIPGADYREIANARHIPMIEHPGVFNGILLDWLGSRR